MKANIQDSAVFKFYSTNLPYQIGDSVKPDENFNSHGCKYFFPMGGTVVSIWEDPEQPVQEPKMCVRIKSL